MRLCSVSLSIALGLLLAGATCGRAVGAGGAVASPVPACRSGEWSAPRALPNDASGQTLIARWPRFAITSSGTQYLVGANLRSFGPTDTLDQTLLTARELDGADLGVPSADSSSRPFRFNYPDVLVDSAGGLHVVWAEPRAATPGPLTFLAWRREKLATLWTARYSPGRSWSAPRRLLDDSILVRRGWNETSHAPAQRDPLTGRAALSMPGDPLGYGAGAVLLFETRGESVHLSRIPTFSAPSYSAVVRRGRTLFVAFITAAQPLASGPSEDVNSVFLQRSDDDGQSWSSPILVSRSGAHPAHYIQLHIAPDRTLHLVWMQERADGPDVIRHVSSRDLGHSWSVPDDLEPAARMLGAIATTMDACGTLHLVYGVLEPATLLAELYYASTMTRWSSIEPLFPGYRTSSLALQQTPDGALLLGFVGIAGAGTAKDDLHTYLAARR